MSCFYPNPGCPSFSKRPLFSSVILRKISFRMICPLLSICRFAWIKHTFFPKRQSSKRVLLRSRKQICFVVIQSNRIYQASFAAFGLQVSRFLLVWPSQFGNQCAFSAGSRLSGLYTKPTTAHWTLFYWEIAGPRPAVNRHIALRTTIFFVYPPP